MGQLSLLKSPRGSWEVWGAERTCPGSGEGAAYKCRNQARSPRDISRKNKHEGLEVPGMMDTGKSRYHLGTGVSGAALGSRN